MRKSAPNGRIYEPQIENQIDSAVAPNPARSVGVEACAGKTRLLACRFQTTRTR